MPLEFSPSEESPDLARIVRVLDDEACRRIISVLEEPMTVPEIAEATDLPTSTTYRKVDLLTEASLVNEAAAVRPGRHQKSRYVADFDAISIDLDDDHDLRVDVERTAHPFAGLWSDVR
ncbi:helix-turn-helix domain-containing protein [Natrialbaceae archaeon GCM10025810]|uniref:helix-turn-helix domain-containing protein n=1 Tax=Halovalidus salilacus TaxID=3075124 RepID=UPI00362316A4